MATTSLNILNIVNHSELNISKIYNLLSSFVETDNCYFILDLISNKEISGKYVYVQQIEQQIYNIETRSFNNQIISKAVTIPFEIICNKILVWANKSNLNRFIFQFTNIVQDVSLSHVEIKINEILSKINKQNTKITKISLKDIALEEDLIGKFTTDLYSYGDVYGILKKYNNQIEKINFQYYILDTFFTISLNNNGNITLYKSYDDIDNEQLDFLKELFIE